MVRDGPLSILAVRRSRAADPWFRNSGGSCKSPLSEWACVRVGGGRSTRSRTSHCGHRSSWPAFPMGSWAQGVETLGSGSQCSHWWCSQDSLAVTRAFPSSPARILQRVGLRGAASSRTDPGRWGQERDVELRRQALEEERRRREQVERRLQSESTRRQQLVEKEVKMREKQFSQVSGGGDSRDRGPWRGGDLPGPLCCGAVQPVLPQNRLLSAQHKQRPLGLVHVCVRAVCAYVCGVHVRVRCVCVWCAHACAVCACVCVVCACVCVRVRCACVRVCVVCACVFVCGVRVRAYVCGVCTGHKRVMGTRPATLLTSAVGEDCRWGWLPWPRSHATSVLPSAPPPWWPPVPAALGLPRPSCCHTCWPEAPPPAGTSCRPLASICGRG